MNKIYFSDIENQLLQCIVSSRFGIKIAVAWFNNMKLLNAVLSKLSDRNYTVELIINDDIRNHMAGGQYQKIIDKGGKLFYADRDRLLHHKFCILDRRIAISGSYNWTHAAKSQNDENIIIMDDGPSVEAYMIEFDRLITGRRAEKTAYQQPVEAVSQRILPKGLVDKKAAFIQLGLDPDMLDRT